MVTIQARAYTTQEACWCFSAAVFDTVRSNIMFDLLQLNMVFYRKIIEFTWGNMSATLYISQAKEMKTMEHGFIDINKAVALAEEAWGTKLQLIPRKRKMFRGTMKDGRTVTLLTPQSSLQSTGHFWVDITKIQYDVMNETDEAVVFFRFDYHAFSLVKWSELKEYLLSDYMYYTDQEKEHWKLYIDGKTIKVNGNPNELKMELYRHTEK